MNRVLCTLLLFFALASQALGGAHAASHPTAEPGECVLCATYTNPIAALPGDGPVPMQFGYNDAPVTPASLVAPSPAVVTGQPRGPPDRI